MGTPLIHHIDYDKISDDIYHLGNKVILRFNLLLSRKGINGERKHYHKEYRYNSKYIDYDKVLTIRRSFDYNLSFDKVDDFGVSVLIRIQDMMLLKMKLQEVATQFNSGIFQIGKKGELKLSKSKPIIIEGLAGGKYLMFEFIIIEEEDTKIQQQGVRLTLTDPSVFCDMSIDRFYGLYYSISQLNMYQSAQIMLNYLGHPEYGTNLTTFSGTPVTIIEQQEEDVKMKDRQLPNNSKSVFDKLDEM